MAGRGALLVGALAAVLAVVVGPAAAGPAPARNAGDRQAEIARELERLRDEFGETVAEEREALAEYQVSRRRQAALDAEAAALDAEIAATQVELEAARQRLAAAEADAARREALVLAAQARLDEAREAATDQAVAAYVHLEARMHPALTMLDLQGLEAAAAFGYSRVVAERQQGVIDRFQQEWDRSQAERDAAVAARELASAEQAAVAQREVDLAARRAAQADAQREAAAEVSRQRELLQRVQATRDRYQARIRSLERESAEIAALLRGRQGGSGTRPGSLLSPLPGRPIGSAFGSRRHPIFGDVRMHAGVDYSAPVGTPVQATADGEVVASRDCGGYGTCVIIDHGGSLATLSAHLSSTRVLRGQRVSAGQVIGAVGATGFATGPHLHFEVRIAGVPVDPVPYL